MTAFDPLASAFEGHGSSPPVKRYECIPLEFKRRCLNRLFPKSACEFSPAWANYITDSNTTFRSQSRGSLIDSDSDSDFLHAATTPGDSAPTPAPTPHSWCKSFPCSGRHIRPLCPSLAMTRINDLTYARFDILPCLSHKGQRTYCRSSGMCKSFTCSGRHVRPLCPSLAMTHLCDLTYVMFDILQCFWH